MWIPHERTLVPDPREFARKPRICNRYLANGTRCTTPTNHHDGWCRTGDCPGYSTPEPNKERFGTARRHSTLPQNPEPCPLDTYEAANLEVTVTARSRFLDVHQGHSQAEAAASIRSLVEDLVVQRRWHWSPSGYLVLAYKGYRVVISPDLSTVTSYETSHAERTWAQVKAGVTSRGVGDRNQRRRARALEYRSGALEAVGISFKCEPEDADDELNTNWATVFTSPEGRTMTFVGRALDQMAVYQ